MKIVLRDLTIAEDVFGVDYSHLLAQFLSENDTLTHFSFLSSQAKLKESILSCWGTTQH